MSIDYDAIRQENIKKYGTDIDQYGPILLENLYSDQTHFIFELLQNAEDAKASQAQFRLYSDRLEFEHDGCPFNEKNVRGICGLAAGTKRNDVNMIGKFGIGFKSVYAHTSSPEIHSADEHFAIDNYVQPRLIDALSTTTKTLFVFPFNHADKTTEESHQSIAKRLQDLSARSLLFLRNINDISFQIEDGHSGNYERRIAKELETDFAKIITLADKQFASETKENWLVFEKDVAHLINEMDLTDEELQIAEDTTLAVQIAFLVSDFESDDKPAIDMLAQSCLSVFFPTERETYLGFLMQGPYQTNSARDDIRKDIPFNLALSNETGELIVEALRWLRDREWLTVNVLNTMPVEYNKFHENDKESYAYVESLFTPIYDRVLTAMKEEALIPAYVGRYISGNGAVLEGSEALRNLLNGKQLQHILDTDREMHWMITADLTTELRRYFLHRVGIDEIDADRFVRRIDRDFISRQSSDWIRQFYEYASVFNSRSYLHTSPFNILKVKPIIRLADDTHVAPYRNSWDDKPQAYLPTEHESQFPTVKRQVCKSDKAVEFLKKLGLKEPDIVDEVEKNILRKYIEGQEIGYAEHMEDIGLIIQALEEDSQVRKKSLVTALKATPFLWATNAIRDSEYRKPDDYIYFRNQTLEMYFAGNPEGWFISSKYEQYFNDLKQLDIWQGVVRSLIESDASGYVTIMNYRGRHVRGLNGFHPGFEIVGLEVALSKPNIERSRYIWNKLLIPNRHLISGEVESCTRQTFVDSKTEWQVSAAGKLVRQKAWLPDGNGNFVKPSELSLEDLPSEFRKDNELANALCMDISDDSPFHNLPENERRKHERVKDRTEEEIIEALEDYDKKKAKELESNETLAPEGIPAELARVFNRPDFPSPRPRPVSSEPTDSALEGERTKTELDLNQESHPIPLALRRKPRAKNRETERYLLDEYGGRCQICDTTFKLRNGSPFFAIAHLIQRSKSELLDNPRNAISLCANHWVQFKHGELKTLDEDILHQIVASEEELPHEILVMLCGEPQVITFSANHISKLRALVEVTENL